MSGSTLNQRSDIDWWTDLLGIFDGKTFSVDSEAVSTEEFSTDACPVGGREFFKGDWFYINRATDYPSLENVHINLQEMFTELF